MIVKQLVPRDQADLNSAMVEVRVGRVQYTQLNFIGGPVHVIRCWRAGSIIVCS